MQRELIIGSFQYLKSSCPRYESWVPLTSPLLWSYSFLTQVCNPSQINFLVWCGVGNEVNFCSISSYSSVIYEKAFPFFFFFFELSWCLFENQWPCMWVSISGFSVVLLWCLSLFHPYHVILITVAFMVSLEIRYWLLWLCCILWISIYIFKSTCQFLLKNLLRFFLDCIESVGQFRENRHLKNM